MVPGVSDHPAPGDMGNRTGSMGIWGPDRGTTVGASLRSAPRASPTVVPRASPTASPTANVGPRWFRDPGIIPRLGDPGISGPIAGRPSGRRFARPLGRPLQGSIRSGAGVGAAGACGAERRRRTSARDGSGGFGSSRPGGYGESDRIHGDLGARSRDDRRGLASLGPSGVPYSRPSGVPYSVPYGERRPGVVPVDFQVPRAFRISLPSRRTW